MRLIDKFFHREESRKADTDGQKTQIDFDLIESPRSISGIYFDDDDWDEWDEWDDDDDDDDD